MEKSATLGTNKTGVDTSPIHSKEMESGAKQYTPATGQEQDLEAMRRSAIEHAERLGSVPIPGTAKGMLKSMMEKFTGNQPAVFVNKLGERLAFERAGTRIYEAMILKAEVANAQGELPFQIPIDRLQHFRREEGEHFQLLVDCMKKLGVDPTAQTPDADVSALAGSGMMKVISDPRTTFPQCMEAMLALELTDNAAWELLVTLAEDLGQDDMARQFESALSEEQTHVREIREWYEKCVRSQASGATH
jgi:ferritin-like metal-binding protein YciE